jgi:hypothetical protein
VTKKAEQENLLKVKQELLEKCERMAKLTSSRPKQKTLLWHAERYREQVKQLTKRK